MIHLQVLLMIKVTEYVKAVIAHVKPALDLLIKIV
jgi:hypothetical protein